MYGQIPSFCKWNTNPCLVRGCAYIVAGCAGIFINCNAAKLAAGSNFRCRAKFQKSSMQKCVYCWSPHLVCSIVDAGVVVWKWGQGVEISFQGRGGCWFVLPFWGCEVGSTFFFFPSLFHWGATEYSCCQTEVKLCHREPESLNHGEGRGMVIASNACWRASYSLRLGEVVSVVFRT